jgi:hypothetical protein
MSRAWQIERQLDREEDRLLADYNAGSISREDYNAEMRQLQHDAREAYEMDREEALRDVDADWGRF